MNGRAQDDWDDRALDAALHELHGSKPHDLSARVLGALHEAAPGPLPELAPVARRPAGPVHARWTVPALAAVLLAAVALGFFAASACWLLARQQPSSSHDGAAVLLDVEVQRGAVAGTELSVAELSVDGLSVAGGGSSPASRPEMVRLARGARGEFVARAGNRLRSEDACAFRLGAFGTLSAPARMELEVRSMELTTKQGVVAASSLTLAVVAGVVTWHTLTHSETAAAGDTLRMQAATDGGAATAMAAENTGLKQRVGELEQQLEQLRAQILERQQVPPAPAPVVAKEPEPPPAEKPGMTFTDPAFTDALAKIDWSTMGAVTNEMGPLLAQLVAAMEKEGAKVPTELAIKVGELNTKLVAQVPAMLEAKLPGFGPNGTYTHPLVSANILASTLEAAGNPLTPAQKQSIDGLVAAFSRENQALAATTRDFEVEQLLAESEMKERFFSEVGGVLAPAQHASMFPEGPDAHDGSGLFTTGLMTRPYTQPVAARDAADFARIASGRVAEELELDEATATKVRALIAQHAAASDLWENRADPVERSLGMLRKGRTLTALRHQVEWMRVVQQQIPLTPDQKKKLAASKWVLVPLPR